MSDKKPMIIVFAGPNGSGKSTITEYVDITDCTYINADLIKSTVHCDDMEAAVTAEKMREQLLSEGKSFAFETVLSTRRNLDLLIKAKKRGYFIKCFYILTTHPAVNVSRVITRVAEGGHDVPSDKIIKRYYKAMDLIPELVNTCDVIHIYDNTFEPFRIFKKKKEEFFVWSNDEWTKDRVLNLIGK